MKGEATFRGAIKLWQTGEAGELLTHFPELEQQIVPIHDKLDAAATMAFLRYRAFQSLPTRKEFAMAVKDSPVAATIFMLYNEAEPTLEQAKTIMRGQSLAYLERVMEVI